MNLCHCSWLRNGSVSYEYKIIVLVEIVLPNPKMVIYKVKVKNL